MQANDRIAKMADELKQSAGDGREADQPGFRPSLDDTRAASPRFRDWNRRTEHREDRGRYLADRGSDHHAGGQRLGRGRPRRRSRSRFRGGVERYSQPGARSRRKCRQDQGYGGRHPRADRLAASRSRAVVDSSKSRSRATAPCMAPSTRWTARSRPWAVPTKRSCRAPSNSVRRRRNGDGRAPDRGRGRGGERRLPPGIDGRDRTGAAAPRISRRQSRRSPRWPTR